MCRRVGFILTAALLLVHSLLPRFGRSMAVAQQEGRVGGEAPFALQVALAPSGMTLVWMLTRDEQLLELPLRWQMADGVSLPYAAWLIALPPGSDATAVRVDVIQLEAARRASLDLPRGDEIAVPSPLPASWPLHVEFAGVMRGVPLARVLFLPVRPDPTGWQIATTLQARVHWPAPLERSPWAQVAPSDPLLRVVAAQVVNPSAIGSYLSPSGSAESHTAGHPFLLVDVAQPGLVFLTRAMLASAGFAVGSPHTLRLRRGNDEVAMGWEGDDDDEFEADERLLFYAQPRFSRYADHDTWILEDAGVPTLRMVVRNAKPGDLPNGALRADFLFEQNQLYTPNCGCRPPLNRDGDRWVWTSLQRGQSWTQALVLPAAVSGPATLTLWFVGYTDAPQSPDHRAQVWLNGALAGEAIWDGRRAVTATFAITLAAASHALTVMLPGLPGVSLEGMWVDALSIRAETEGVGLKGQPMHGEVVPRAYRLGFTPNYLLDVTMPAQPVRLINWQADNAGVRFADPAEGLPRAYVAFTEAVVPLRVRAPTALDPAQGDLHIVAHADLLPALAPLIARRRSQGLGVVVQTAQALYDHYGDGRMDPAAIRAYFAARYRSDSPRPAYALLVGDGTFDPKRYQAASPATSLPTFLAEVDPFLGETAAENRFVTVDGDDTLPDISLGRWPTNTFTETQSLVSKTLSYEDALLMPGERRVLFVADDADAAGNFPAKALSLAGVVLTTYITVTALMTTPLALMTTRTTLLNQWPASRLVAFVGHASPRQWAAERLFHLDDVPSLSPANAPPVVVGLTCYTARFHELQNTLDEALLRAPGRGAVATWGATGLTIASGHEPLGRGFIVDWLAGGRLGDAALAGKLSLSAGGLYLDLLDTYALLGDPVLLLNQRWAIWALYLPVIQR